MPIETPIKTNQILEKGEILSASKATEILYKKSRNLGQIMEEYPEYGSNSGELYLLAYLKELGSAKI